MQTGMDLIAAFPLHPGLGSEAQTAPSWARGGIRKEVNTARVLSYDHGDMRHARNLKSMAEHLLRNISTERPGDTTGRPLFFICHSIGGLVAKLALTLAKRSTEHRSLLENCYGITFFATPHRGSSHLSNRDFKFRIQELLSLTDPFTPKLMDELKLDHPTLLKIDDNFKGLASELQIWTFYETEDSVFSADGVAGSDDIPFKVPITSMRSAILALRHENVYALQSNHTNCASFGMKNVQTMKMYLRDLAKAIRRAESLSKNSRHVHLRLERRVKVEVHGFYENYAAQGSSLGTTLRLLSTKQHSLQDFWKEGPDGLLEQRLHDIQPDASNHPEDAQFFPRRERAPSLMPLNDIHTVGNEPDNRARQPSAGGRPPLISAGVSRSMSRDDSGLKTDQSMEQPGEFQESASVSGAIDVSDGEYSPKQQTVTTPARASSRSLGCPSTTQSEPKGPISRTTTGSETLDSTASTYIDPSHSSSPRRRSSQLTGRLNPPADPSYSHLRQLRESEPASRQDMRRPSKRTSPSNATRKFVWIHIPFNNPLWVRKVFDTLSVKEQRDYVELFNSEHWASRHARGRHSQHHASFLKPACGYTPLMAKQPPLSPKGPASLRHARSDVSTLKQQGQGCIYLYLPFLHFDTYRNLIKRREMIRRRLIQGRTRPVPSDLAKETSKELLVIWKYLGHDPPLNCRRTLDQYRYPSLHDTSARDDDQMLYKMTKERAKASNIEHDFVSRPGSRGDSRAYTHTQREEDDDDLFSDEIDDLRSEADNDLEDGDADIDPDDGILDGNVLMVDQLWLWVIDTTSLITFFPSREGDPMEGPLYQQADLRDSIFNEVNADLTQRCENALDLAALAVLQAVSVLIDRSSHPNLEIFRIFEEAISILTEKMTSSLKRFRTLGYRDKYGIEEEEEDHDLKTASIRARHKREDERAERENQDNTSALLELRDIEDELSTLKHLFEEQEEQIKTMLTIYSNYGCSETITPSSNLPAGLATYTFGNNVDNQRTATPPPALPPHTPLSQLTKNGMSFLDEALAKLKSYRTQAEDMIKRVVTTRHDFDKLLETVQRQAQIDEVRLSRQQADLASAQNRSVMIFTVFTVIFLPLSFFTSLFGMNTQEWGGGGNLPLHTIGSISLPASAFLVIVALVVAWSISVRKAFKNLRRGMQSYQKRTRQWWNEQVLTLLFDSDETKSKGLFGRRRRKALEGKKPRKRVNREPTLQDFWERHREEMGMRYEIPLRNRRVPGRMSMARAKARARKQK
ncbi:Protein SERAC1 [Cytospora mali]|uniref:Protein SERAC1 n=1 Tax=Cytospora mali TaxID=578113 RepID=A0A194W482_CYTMA|nr:Protein SERAC1 [Valsa mali]